MTTDTGSTGTGSPAFPVFRKVEINKLIWKNHVPISCVVFCRFLFYWLQSFLLSQLIWILQNSSFLRGVCDLWTGKFQCLQKPSDFVYFCAMSSSVLWLKVVVLCWLNALSNGEGSESCRSYENENVYPHTKPTTNTDHQLQWTKAMSKLNMNSVSAHPQPTINPSLVLTQQKINKPWVKASSTEPWP